MVAQSSIFPIFLRAEFQENQAFARFQSDAQRAANAAKREFQGVAAAVDEALTRQRGSSGALNLGVDELREAAAAQQARAIAAREVADATLRAATADGRFNAEMRQGVVAARNFANEQDRLSTELQQQITVLDAVQRELNQTASATDLVTQAGRRGTNSRSNVINSVRSERVAFIQLGQQMQDVTIQTQLGTNAFIIFSQQVPQAAFALSGLANSANATKARIGQLATFLSGPWGAALFAATAVLGPLIFRLFDTADAADEARSGAFNFASGLDILSLSAKDAQSAIDQLNSSLKSAIKLQGDFLSGEASIAQQTLARVRAEIAADQQAISRVEKSSDSAAAFLLPQFFGPSSQDLAQVDASRARLEKNLALVAKLEESAGSAALALGNREVEERLDPIAKQIRELDEAIGSLNQRRRETVEGGDPLALAFGGLSQEDFTDQLEALARQRKALEDQQRQAGKKVPTPRDTSARELREQQRLAEFAEDAQSKIAAIRDRFTEIPPEVAKINTATRTLDDLISDLGVKKPDGFEGLISQARELKAELAEFGIEDALDIELGKLREGLERNLEIQRLTLAGRDDEAEALRILEGLQRQYGDAALLTKEEVEGIVRAHREDLEALTALKEQQDAFLDATQSVRGELEKLFAGEKVDFESIFRRLQARLTVEQLFGDALRNVEKAVKSSFDVSVEKLEANTDKAGDAAINLANKLTRAGGILDGSGTAGAPGAAATLADLQREFDAVFAKPGAVGAANDNEITVTANRLAFKQGLEESNTALSLTPERFAVMLGESLTKPLLAGLPPALAQAISPVLSNVIAGQFLGGTFGGAVGGLKGLFGTGGTFGISKTRAEFEKAFDIKSFGGEAAKIFDGAFGALEQSAQVKGLFDALGIKGSTTGGTLGSLGGKELGKLIPGVGGPLGSLIGSVFGNLIGGALKGTPKASALIGGTGSTLGIEGFTGGSKLQGAAGDLGGSVLDTINRIAEQLGADVNAALGSVSIGLRKDNIRVDPSGGGATKTGKGAVDFGQDSEAAIRFAVLDLIQDGVIAGLSAAEERLLKQGKDLEKALTDVLTFRSVIERIEGNANPLRAELLALNREFESLIDLFTRAGASAEQFAGLEALFLDERQKLIEDSIRQVAGSLQDLVSDLLVGESGLSLRDRRANALTEFEALRARVEAGDTSAFDDFAQASRDLLDIERQLFGSQAGFFDRFNEILQLSQSAIAQQEALAASAEDVGSPFGSGIDPIGVPIAQQTAALVDELQQLGFKLDAVNINLGAINDNSISGSGVISFSKEVSFF